MLLPTILMIGRDSPFGDTQPCPFCTAPVCVQRWVERIYDDPRNPDDDHADHITHRVFIHGETPLICFPVRRPGGADGVLVDDWQAITDTLRDTHSLDGAEGGAGTVDREGSDK